MKNRDRDDTHRRRREAGQDDDESRDGKEVAETLYGGLPTDSDKIDDEADAAQQ